MPTNSYTSYWQPNVRSQAKVAGTLVSQGAGNEEEQCIQNAVVTYSRLRPRKLTYTGSAPAGAATVLSDLVEGWTPSTHRLVNLYSPNRQTRIDPNDEIFETYVNSDGEEVLYFNELPSGELWLEYTAQHVLETADDGDDTIRSEALADYWPVVHLAAYYILLMAANKYVEMSRSSSSADSLDFDAQAKKAMDQAKAERLEFDTALGILPEGAAAGAGATAGGSPGVVPYSARANWDSKTTGGSDRFSHSSRWT